MSKFAPAAVLFDLDGTLVDSAPDVARSVNVAFQEAGQPQLSVDTVKDLVGKGASALVEAALRMHGVDPAADQIKGITDRFLSVYAAEPIVHTTLFPGAVEAVQRLLDAGVPVGICTNKPAKTTQPVLEALGLDKLFKVVLCGDQAKQRKPNGGHVLETMALLGVSDRRRSVMVGDSENDIYAAHDAGVPSVCVTFGYCHEPLDVLKPSVVIDRFDDLDGALVKALAAGAAA